MIALHLLGACVALLLCAMTPTTAGEGERAPGLSSGFVQRSNLYELIRRRPMIFFVAKGGPDACGPGCSEWIAAEGDFDLGSAQRFRDFLNSLEGRTLPIFFNSLGGYVPHAQSIGRILRTRRMTAGIARTVPEGCRVTVATDESCRRLIQSRPESKAQLREAGASCISACVYALIGASVRQIPMGSRIGLHATRFDREVLPGQNAPRLDDVYLSTKRYVAEMGTDPAVVDMAAKLKADQIRYLNRVEIARFGIEVQGSYETPWLRHRESSGQRFVLKSITQSKGVDGKEFRTTSVRLSCAGPGLGVWFVYRRELPANEIDVPTSIRVAAGGREFLLGLGTKGPNDQRSAIADREFLHAAIAMPNIVITETFSPHDVESWSRQVKLSTEGLARALDDVQTDCGWPKYLNPIGASFGR